jgi:imidazolonepropionase-like amidohydrolase
MLRAMHDQGVTIVAGTDDIPGLSLHRELEIYVEAGLPPSDVLRLATHGAAVLMRRNADLGSIAAGRIADLVLVEGDPTRTIGDIRRTVLVVKGGTMFDPDQVHAALGIAPRTAAVPETR